MTRNAVIWYPTVAEPSDSTSVFKARPCSSMVAPGRVSAPGLGHCSPKMTSSSAQSLPWSYILGWLRCCENCTRVESSCPLLFHRLYTPTPTKLLHSWLFLSSCFQKNPTDTEVLVGLTSDFYSFFSLMKFLLCIFDYVVYLSITIHHLEVA